MADESTPQVLTKFSLDLTDFNSAVKEAKETLNSLAQEEKDNVAASQAATARAIDSVKQQVALQKQLQAESEALTAQEKLKTAQIATQAKTQEVAAEAIEQANKQAIDAQRLQEQQAKATAAQNKILAEQQLAASYAATEAAKQAAIAQEQSEKAQEAAIRKTILLLREKALAERGESAEGPGGLMSTLFGGMMGKHALEATTKGVSGIAGAAVGGGASGQLLSGLLGGFAEGGMAVFAIEQISEALEKMVDKVKELTIETGKLSTMYSTFDRLARGKGIEDSTEFIEKLRTATKNQVDDMTLLRTANTFLQSNMKMTADQMVALTGATVNLSRASGKDATAAIGSLNKFFLTGRAQTLSYATGIQRQELAVRGLGAALTETERAQANFNKASSVIEERSKRMGELPLTLAESLKSLANVQNRLKEGFGLGMQDSPGLSRFAESIAGVAEALDPLEKGFMKLGESVGNALGQLSPFVDLLVQLAGPVMKPFIESVKTLATTIGEILANAIKLVSGLVSNVMGAAFDLMDGHLTRTKENTDEMAQAFANSHPILDALGKTMITAAEIAGTLGNALKLLVDVASSTPDTLGKAFTDWYSNQKTMVDKMESSKTEFEKAGAEFEEALKKPKEKKPEIEPGKPTDDSARNKRRLQKETIAEERAALAESLAEEKEYLSQARQAEDEAYKQGLESATRYYEHRRALVMADAQIQRNQAEEQHRLTLEQIDDDLKRSDATAADAAKRRQTADDVLKKALANADKMQQTGLYGVSKEELGTQAKDQIAQIELVSARQEAAIKDEQHALDTAHKEGLVSDQDYLAKRIDLINQEVEKVKEAEEAKIEAKRKTNTFTLNDLNSYEKAIQSAILNAQSQLQELDDTLTQTVFQDIQKNFGNISGALQERLSIANLGPTGQAQVGTPQDIQEQMLAANRAQISAMEDLLATTTPYSNTWFEIYNNILKATQQQAQLNEQLKDTQNIMLPIANLFTQIGQQTSQLFGSRFAKGLASTFSGIGTQFESMQKNVDMMFGRGGGVTQDPRLQAIIQATDKASTSLVQSGQKASDGLSSYSQKLITQIDELTKALAELQAQVWSTAHPEDTGALSGVAPGEASIAIPSGTGGFSTTQSVSVEGGASADIQTIPTLATPHIDDAAKGFKGLASSLKEMMSGTGFPAFVKQIQGFVGAFGGFFDTISHAGSASAGALGGAMGGAGLGGQVGGAMEGMSGIFGMSTAAAGPIGMAVGAAAGMISGMISGQKQEQITDNINKLNLSFKQTMDAFSSNNASLKSTMDNIQNLIAQAQEDMATSKKGHSQYADLIKQYNEQLQQLQDQAASTMADMKKQLLVLGEPTAYQDITNQVDSIIQSYEKFAGAAQNATDLANANKYLQESLEQFAVQQTDTLRQDEETQIQAALQLNDLYNQRNQLQYQYLQQIEQIQGQGSLTRTQTRAQSGYAQFFQAQATYAQQMDQINQQIALTSYQVSAAQKVFDLATTKAGLEAQLLQLQEVGIDKDMQRIAAVQNLLSVLQQTGYNIVTGSAANPTQQALQILQLLLGLLAPGQAGQVAGSGDTIVQLYAQLSSLGVGSLRGQGL